MLTTLKTWAGGMKRDVYALYIAARDPRTPWSAKLIAFIVAAYALSPIDLIPDFVPVVGYLDDLLLVPLGIMLAVRLIPPPLMAEYREAARHIGARPVSLSAAVVVGTIWVAVILTGSIWVSRRFS